MKLRKTRIKKTTKANGTVQYMPEYKWGFWWKQFNDSEADIDIYRLWHKESYVQQRRDMGFMLTLDYAKYIIDQYLSRIKYDEACKSENNIVKVEYEDYP